MKRADYIVIVLSAALVFLFTGIDPLREGYLLFNSQHGMITSFLKFGLLATLGEMIALRLRKGIYYEPTFGIGPKFLVWGLLGLTIKMAFVIFATGTPVFMEYNGFNNAIQVMKGSFSVSKIWVALGISTAMNLIYAPIMMTFHKITDFHIHENQGSWKSLITPIHMASLFKKIDWEVHWHFVLKKTIPFFWIPAHTITFLLPVDFQVLFAALLSLVLGLILAIASLKSKN